MPYVASLEINSKRGDSHEAFSDGFGRFRDGIVGYE